MVRYERDTKSGRIQAVFEGKRVTVEGSRARRYPGLECAAQDTLGAYRVIAGRLLELGVRRPVADLGAGAGEGAELLASVGFSVRAVEQSAEAVEFARARGGRAEVLHQAIERAPLGDVQAVTLVDVLGLTRDDAGLLRAVARAARGDVVLLGAVPLADLGHALAAPAEREFTPASLEATLLRGGFGVPVALSHTDGMLVFEARPAASRSLAEALTRADEARLPIERAGALLRLSELAASQREPAPLREVLLAMGKLQAECDEHAAAEQALLAANAVAPEEPRVYVALGALRARLGEPDDAAALIDHALGLDPTHAPAWRALASLHEDRGDARSARECLAQAVALEPGDRSLTRDLARWCQLRGDLQGVVDALSRLVSWHPSLSAQEGSWPGWMFLAQPLLATTTTSRE